MVNYKELIGLKMSKIKEIEDKIQDDLNEKKKLLSEIKELKRQIDLREINELIRVGSYCYIPQHTGGGFKVTVTKLEILENFRFEGVDFKYFIKIEGILNNGKEFYYSCPYDSGEFLYCNYSEMYPTDLEIIVKKY